MWSSFHQLHLESLRNAGSLVPPQTSEVGNGAHVLTCLPSVPDAHYNFRTTTLGNLHWHFSNHVPWKTSVLGSSGGSRCSLASSNEFGKSCICILLLKNVYLYVSGTCLFNLASPKHIRLWSFLFCCSVLFCFVFGKETCQSFQGTLF